MEVDHMLTVGLTGGVATGKSTVARRLRELGAEIVDADLLARDVVAPGEPGLREVQREFGDDVIAADGTLDRGKLGAIIFASPDRRKALEAIIHPKVRARMRDAVLRVREHGTASVVVCDIPLLYESGVNLELVDRVLVVYARPEVQKERLMKRNQLSAEEADARIAAQLPTRAKAERADDVIDNSGALEETLQQVDRIWKEWQSLCASR